MSNILGEHFQDWVTDQITTRQKALGYRTDVTDDTLKYINTKTPWLRLASSVNLTNEGPPNPIMPPLAPSGPKTLEDSVLKGLIKNGVPENLITGDNLAKNFILQGSVSSLDHKNRYEGVKFGLNTVDSLFGGLYGWGGMEERGYVPPPGITQASVQHQNNGSLTKTIVNIKCFSRAQFQLLDVLYLRPGYTLLLEWGWSQYLDNDNKLKEFGPFKTTPFQLLFNKCQEDMDHFDMYNAIEEETEEYDGNYGAIYGKVCNFSWKFNKDGSYDVSVQITGMGDVIESLKSNVTKTDETEKSSLFGFFSEWGVDDGDDKEEDKCLLYQELSELFQFSEKNPNREDFYYSNLQFEHFPYIKDLEYKKLDKIDINRGLFSVTGVKSGWWGKIGFGNRMMYLTFGTLLAIIQKKLLLYSKGVPLTGFDVNFEKLHEDENYIITFPGHFSSNPNICLIPYTESNLDLKLNFGKNKDTFIRNFDIHRKLAEGDNFHIDGNPYLGRLMNIYINRDYIVEIMDDIINEDGSVPIIDLLQSILSGVSLSLGSVNKLSIKETRNGLIKFWEESPQQIANIPKEDRKLPKFNVFGVKPGIEGSFIRNVGLDCKISDNFTTMITVGAQVNSNQPSENAVSFSNYNAGLKDRVVEERISTGELGKNTPAENIKKIWNEKIYPDLRVWTPLYAKIFRHLQFHTDNTSELTNYNSEYSKLMIGVLSTMGPDQQIPPNFFLPFSIDLEMDGLAGMVIYQKFKISDNILPVSYDEDKINLLITGLDHTITPESWITTVTALSSPAPPDLNVPPPPSSSQNGEKDKSQNGEKDKCGEKELDIATINPPRGVDTPRSLNAMKSSLNAMEKSFKGVFSENKEVGGLCALYSYNLAFNYTNFLKNPSSSLSQMIRGTGHTNQSSLHQNIKNLGYEMEKVGTNINKGDIWSIFKKVSFGIGDIVIYWANTGDPSSSARKYGHTQIYIGDVNPEMPWTSSKKKNYGTSFVYSGTKVTESECWDMLIFRAPPPPTSSV
jgi:hypothetical protein